MRMPRTQLPGIPAVMCPPSADPLEVTLRHIEIVVDAEGWDQPASLFWLFEGTGGGIQVLRPPLRQAAARMYPPDMFALLGAGIHRATWLRTALLGVVLVAESWGATADQTDAAASAQLFADGEARQIGARPDRFELRLATLVTVGGGRQVGLVRQRYREARVVDASTWEGVVIEAHRRFVQVAAKAAGR